MSRYKVIDYETQTHTLHKRKASPFHPDNYIVAAGWKNQGDVQCSYDYNPEYTDYEQAIEDDITLLIGFNFKFDLMYQWDKKPTQEFFKRGGKIWDCQYAEYLLNGMDARHHFPALTDVAPRYGGVKKIDEVKILWDAGVQTSDINKDLLLDYLIGTEEEGWNSGDIGNTEKVFLGQLKKAIELGMLKAIMSRMDGLLATTEMEYNGLKIDMQEAAKQLKSLTIERAEAAKELSKYVPELPEELVFNWNSNAHKSCIIFGGTIKYQKPDTYPDPKTGDLARLVAHEVRYQLDDGTVSDLVYEEGVIPPLNTTRFKGGKRKGEPKTKKVKVQGELKTRLTDFFFKFDGYTEPQPSWKTANTDGAGQPIYQTNADVIEALGGSGVPFCETMASHDALNKEITTYFMARDKKGNLTGMLTCVDKDSRCIHHRLNHTSTVTARLSSSYPNLQNIPRADKSNLKRVFVSRFGNKGMMIEADYSQLEVVVQGVLSKDPQLCQDLRDKIDFHCKRVALSNNISYKDVLAIIKNEDHPDHSKWKVRRTKAKIFSFQRAYGAGASLIAVSTGMHIDEVKSLIASEEKTYRQVVMFYESVHANVVNSAEPFRDPGNNFRVFRRGQYTTHTGCRYNFRSYPAKDWQLERGIQESFSPTEMKNYPIQGEGGEIVQGICGKLWRHFVSNNNYNNKAFLCNTVHDCVWVDCHEDVYKEVAKDVKRIMEDVQGWYDQFSIKITVPFPVDVEAGRNMLELKHIED